MTKVVFIFGAGASRPLGVPVMNGFLDRAYDLLNTGQTISAVDFDRVFRIIAALQILHAKSETDLRNVESVFNLFEMSQLVGRLPGVDEEDFKAASASIRVLLAQTIERSCFFPVNNGRVEPGDPYRSLVHRLRERQRVGQPVDWAFITFNYDIALDFAINWSNLGIDYGLAPKTPDPATVGLYKLHGSLNWTECECGATVPFPHDMIKYRGEPARAVTVDLNHQLPKLLHCQGHKVTGLPAIVPPSWNKTQYQRSFGRVWQRAASELTSAENIIVVGYSLPESDAFFHDLFRLGVAGPTRVKRFVVVNPDKASEGRFRALLGPELEQRFQHRLERVEHALDWMKGLDW